MARLKKNGKYVNFYVDRQLCDEFDRMCSLLGQTKTAALERAMSYYVEKRGDPAIFGMAQQAAGNGPDTQKG